MGRAGSGGVIRAILSPRADAGRTAQPRVGRRALLVNLGMTARQASDKFAPSGEDVMPVMDSLGGSGGVMDRAGLKGYETQMLRPDAVAGGGGAVRRSRRHSGA